MKQFRLPIDVPINATFSDGRPRTGLAWVALLAPQVVPTELRTSTNIRLYFTAPFDAINGAL
jgi:hypothetical protein